MFVVACTVVIASVGGGIVGCSDSSGDDPAPVGGINGPARVDPDGGATVSGGTGG